MQSFNLFAKSWVQSSSTKSSTAKIKASLISILLGLVLASIVLLCMNKNPIDFFTEVFKTAFLTKDISQTTWAVVALLLVSGLANAIAFKTGLFNIGVSGQMFFTGVIVIIFGIKFMAGTGMVGVVMLLILGMLVGGLVAALSGVLKAYFNVHEVVSTILLNWSLYFIGIWLLKRTDGVMDYQGISTQVLDVTSSINRETYGMLSLIIAIAAALLIAILFWKTTFGFSLKTTGLSKDAAQYAGIAIRRNIILSMALSGVMAGLLGVIMFVFKEGQISNTYIIANVLPQVGFDGIAIALLAYSNPIGIIPISIFFGIIQNGSDMGVLGLDKSVSNLIIGIIIYFAAISVVFQNFKVWRFCYVMWMRFTSKDRKAFKSKVASIDGTSKSDVRDEMKLYDVSFYEKYDYLASINNDVYNSDEYKKIISNYKNEAKKAKSDKEKIKALKEKKHHDISKIVKEMKGGK